MTSRLYGAAPLGSITYGYDTITEPLFGLSIDWERLGYFTGRNEAQKLDSFHIRRGRRHYIKTNGDGFEQEDTGTMSITMSDPDREYFPFTVASPLYGKISPNRRTNFRVVTPDGNSHNLFTGNVTDVNPVDGVVPKATIEMVDGWDLLRGQRRNITVELQENVFADEIIPLILNKANYPSSWGYDLNSGLDVQPFWWVDRRNAADAIFDVIHSELGRVFINSSGAVSFRNRYYTETPVTTITDEDYIYDTFQFLTPWEIQRNVISVVVKPRSEKTEQVLWSLPQIVPINNGQTYEFFPEFTYNNNTVPAKDVQDPIATANTLEDGTGTDLSSGLVLTKEPLGNSVKITVLNNSGSNGYLRTTTISGKPIVVDAEVPLQKSNILELEDAKEFTLDLPWVQNIQRADGFTDFMLEFLAASKQYIQLTLKPNPNVQFAIDLGSTVAVNSSLHNVNQNFFVAYIEHKHYRKQNYTLTSLFLEPLPDVDSYWHFGFSAFGETTKFAP